MPRNAAVFATLFATLVSGQNATRANEPPPAQPPMRPAAGSDGSLPCRQGMFEIAIPASVVARLTLNDAAKSRLGSEKFCVKSGARIYVSPGARVHYATINGHGERTELLPYPRQVLRPAAATTLLFADGTQRTFPPNTSVTPDKTLEVDIDFGNWPVAPTHQPDYIVP